MLLGVLPERKSRNENQLLTMLNSYMPKYKNTIAVYKYWRLPQLENIMSVAK